MAKGAQLSPTVAKLSTGKRQSFQCFVEGCDSCEGFGGMMVYLCACVRVCVRVCA